MKRALICLFFFFCVGCLNNAEDNLLKSAEHEWQERRYRNSVETYRSLVDKFPRGNHTEEALFRLGEIYRLNLDREREALVYFYRLVKRGSEKYALPAQKNIADIYQNDLRDYDQAVIEYAKLIHMESDIGEKAKGQFKLAKCYFKKGDYQQAVTEFELLLRDYPESGLREKAAFQISNCFFILGSCDRAIEGYRKFLKQYSSSQYASDARYSIGNCLEEQEDLSGALAMYQSIENSGFNQKVLERKIRGLEERLKKRRR